MIGNELLIAIVSVVVVISATITLYFILNSLHALKVRIQIIQEDEVVSVAYDKGAAQSEVSLEQLSEVVRQILLSESESRKKYLTKLSENLNAYFEKLFCSILRKISALLIFYFAHFIVLFIMMYYVALENDHFFRLFYTRFIIFLIISLHGGLSVYFLLIGFQKPSQKIRL